jgi:TPP-dependent pyruvate/acetoin dehydrogenase alpha subunit
MTTLPTADIARRLLREMLRIRLVEERIVALYPEQEMRCPVHLCIGQEAVAAGVCAQLGEADWVFSNHRSHGHYLARGGDLSAFLAELYGKQTGCAGGRGGSMHLIDQSVGFLGSAPIVGSTIPHAVGAALAAQFRGEERVVAVFFGEGATEEGVFHESINFAQLRKLPVLFVCENNLYSVYSPLSVRQPKGRTVGQLTAGHGVMGFHGEGNDVADVHKLAGRAVERVRSGAGPVFLEFDTYRWREHCGPNYDNDAGYRTPEEFEEWKQRCPVETFRARLLEERALSASEFSAWEREIAVEIDAAVAFAKQSPPADPADLFRHIDAT